MKLNFKLTPNAPEEMLNIEVNKIELDLQAMKMLLHSQITANRYLQDAPGSIDQKVTEVTLTPELLELFSDAINQIIVDDGHYTPSGIGFVE